MRTALDTNIISALWSNEQHARAIASQLLEARRQGALVISGIVYCELLAYPAASERSILEFCDRGEITIDLQLKNEVWSEAGRRFALYADRRRKSTTEGPRRLVADFLVGAHALIQAERLMTADARRYKTDFPELSLY